MKKAKVEYLHKTKLKSRGWTESLINKFLGDPEKTKQQCFHGRVVTVPQYDLRRVESVEQTPDFIDGVAKAKKRSLVQIEAAQNRVDEAEELKRKQFTFAHTANIKVEKWNYDHLRNWVVLQNTSRRNQTSSIKSTIVLFVIDNLTNWASLREEIRPIISHKSPAIQEQEAINRLAILEKRLLKKIGETYPKLNAEVRRQITV